MNTEATNPALDEETLARAILTFCIDGADALMYATIKGCDSAVKTLQLIDSARSVRGHHTDLKALDWAFATGTARWGRRVNAQGMDAFHRSLERWQARLDQLPSHDRQTLTEWITDNGTQWIISPGSPCWPEQLSDLSTHNDWASPLCLWGYGDASSLVSCDKPMAVVGSRGVDEYGRYVARSVGEKAAENGHLVVSGGAYGADAAAHWGALESMSRLGRENSGRTVAVFAGGLNHIGPERNRELFERIAENGGALISELCPNTVPEARRFLLRNRIIAALASTVVVAQARNRSGALNTANWAAELGREVYAAPGDINIPHNTGCNHLISENRAMLLTSVSATEEICHTAHVPFHPLPDAQIKKTSGGAIPHLSSNHVDNRHNAPEPMNDAPRLTNTDAIRDSKAQSASDERQSAVLSAIRACTMHKIFASQDNILRALNSEKPNSRNHSPKRADESTAPPWTIRSLNEELGEMELFGQIHEKNGCFTIPATPATDS